MNVETYLSDADVIEVIRLLEEEVQLRVRNGDGEVAPLQRAIVALGEGDRIVIGDY